jgi:hypothetical protein
MWFPANGHVRSCVFLQYPNGALPTVVCVHRPHSES